jgi:dTDP-4-amino-4,6-dideoxygalactose transaminase
MRSDFLAFSPPSIGEDEIAEVVDVLRSGWLTTGPKTKRFENDFAGFLGAESALATNSGTAALHLALAVLGVQRGDAVISTPMTFCSCINLIEQIGARPILVDVEDDTLNIDPTKVEKAAAQAAGVPAGSPLKALMPVHLYGHPCEIDALVAIAEHFGIALIEDAAHALPARFRGRLVGGPPERPPSIPQLAAFSFYATKNLTTGEGGMLVGPAELLEQARTWSLHGMSLDAYRRYTTEGSWRYDVLVPGFKYNLPDVLAAIGIHQLRRLPALHERRRQIAQAYGAGLRSLNELAVPTERPHAESAWQLYVIRLNLETLRIDRARFVEELRALNIGTSVHFIPIHLLSYYQKRYGFRPDDFPVATRNFERIVSLPMSPVMTDQDVADVIEAVTAVAGRFAR